MATLREKVAKSKIKLLITLPHGNRVSGGTYQDTKEIDVILGIIAHYSGLPEVTDEKELRRIYTWRVESTQNKRVFNVTINFTPAYLQELLAKIKKPSLQSRLKK